jgi:hypothetical protein
MSDNNVIKRTPFFYYILAGLLKVIGHTGSDEMAITL